MSSRSISAIPKRLFSATLSSALSLGLVVGTGLSAYSTEAIKNRLVTYQDDGKTLFALSLLPTQEFAAKSSPQVAVVVDTSASQNGDFRTDSIAIAQSIVEALPASAMVTLLACDVDAIVLSKAVAPTSESLAEGFKKLEMRIPLGTTDLAGALRAAAKELDSQPDSSIVYIGDGMHLCNLLNTAEFESLINEMRRTRTSVSSIAIGPKTDCELLATISNHTGGKVFVRQGITDATCQQIGDALAKVALEPVFWPSKSNWPTGVASYLPAQLPPLRLDRDSIVLGSLKSDAVEGNLQLDGIVGGQPSSMRWDLKSEPSNPDFAFLAQVISKSTPNAGLMMPTAGSDALQELGTVLANSSDQLVKDARFALNSGDTSAAINIAKEAIKRSPNNLAAQNILNAAEQTSKPAKPVRSFAENGEVHFCTNSRRSICRPAIDASGTCSSCAGTRGTFQEQSIFRRCCCAECFVTT
jgi:Mg-chelatase subunit ChlD